jgi:SPP1 family predicted phage head-tail adaptor
MRASELTHRIYLQRATEAQSATGFPVKTWTTLQHVWANVQMPTGKEYFTSDRYLSEVPAAIRIRRSKDVMSLRAKDRALVPSAYTTLKERLATTSDTSVVVEDDVFPPDHPFVIQVGAELMYVSATSTTTLTVTRGAYGTTAAKHKVGSAVRMMDHFDIESVVQGKYEIQMSGVRRDEVAST